MSTNPTKPTKSATTSEPPVAEDVDALVAHLPEADVTTVQSFTEKPEVVDTSQLPSPGDAYAESEKTGVGVHAADGKTYYAPR